MDATPTVKRLNERGQCCGRKPTVYKRPTHFLFCSRCNANFDPITGEQIENWAYVKVNGGLVRRYDERTDSVFDPVTQTYQPIKRDANAS
jgi:hypothetical protein